MATVIVFDKDTANKRIQKVLEYLAGIGLDAVREGAGKQVRVIDKKTQQPATLLPAHWHDVSRMPGVRQVT